jgi:hypothetical protein
MILPRVIYDNRVEPKVGDFLYVVPESDSIIAEQMEISEVYGLNFVAGEYRFAWTGNAVHVGKSITANAYDSEAAYYAIKILSGNSGWVQYPRRRDVYCRTYVNKHLSPPLKNTAFIQLDHVHGKLIMNGWYAGEGVNMLQELSERFEVDAYGASAFEIRGFLEQADAIILASYAMNVRPVAPKKAKFYGETIASARKAFFDGGI